MKTIKLVVRLLFGVFFLVAGVTHFTNRDFFTAIVPPYLPWPVMLVYVSGVAEIVIGVMLMVPATSRLAGWLAIALLIAVFPANIHMAMNPQLYPDVPLSALLIRLPLQGVLVALAYWFTRAAPSLARSPAVAGR
jgi:uncharacterized membrane protein